MTIVTVGIDLAKNVFAVHGVDETGKPVLVRPDVPRAKLLDLIANLTPCLIGRPPLGTRVCQVRPPRAPDGPQVRGAVSHERQARQE